MSEPDPDNDSSRQQQQHAERVACETIHTPDKTLYVDLKINHRGLHFRITEETRGKRSAIVVPLEAAAQIAAALVRLGKQAESMQ